jgi:hypothetical protein
MAVMAPLREGAAINGRRTKSAVNGLVWRASGGRSANAPTVGWPGRASNLLSVLPRDLTHESIVLDQHIREGRFQRALSLIAAFSALLSAWEVGIEHIQGSYGQRIMYAPLVSGPLLVVAGVWGVFSRTAARVALPLASLANVATGVTGFVFHIRGVQRKPGGWRIPLFTIPMGPPLFAPLLFGISGFLGLIASLLRREDDPEHALAGGLLPRRARLPGRVGWARWLPQGIVREGESLDQEVREGRFQQFLAAAMAVFAVFNGAEALYSHYKNNFRNRIEWTPILLTPGLIVAGIGTIWSRTIGRTLLPLASLASLAAGGLGFFMHARGFLRRPGGLRMPRHNLVYGPPLFAPLLFAATGFLGVLASLLRRAK